eukprot:TRINITY_DN57703_c0_g1_i1.p1 TRINITY_DN57703_c0_g1~~TRINITY_DN57703_c0_g1_i1.p1  ORF type:complete len:387 (+),score=94.93 TRINITY_DN57703_c0_g1_i1:55-1161(+)
MASTGGWEVLLARKWTAYGDEEAKLLEDAMKEGRHTIEYEMRGHHYVVDLDSMQQVNSATGKTRPVRSRAMEGVGEEEGDEEEHEIKDEPEEATGENTEEEEVKDEAAEEDEPAAKKRKICPITAPDFLRDAEPRRFRFQALPRKFKKGSYGWHGFKVVKIKSGELAGIVIQIQCIVKVVGSASGNAKKFLKVAPTKNLCLTANPVEFSTGSLGWSMYKKGRLLVDGKMVTGQIYLNAVVRGSKRDKAHVPSTDPVTVKLDPAVRKEVEVAVGPAPEGSRDDLKKIAGIGPCTEARLNSIGIRSFDQMAKMTPDFHDKVMRTIEYFPKEALASRKSMVADAKTLASGRMPVRSRTFHADDAETLIDGI